MASNLIKTGALDFSEIKDNLKTFLSGQTELSDYDFDGSVISTLIDVLAYNTHYNALYTNFAINEMFIDSASKRSSLTSIAKLLGYIPKSISSSRAVCDITVGPYGVETNTLTLPTGTTFSTEINNVAYKFSLIDPITATKATNATNFVFSEATIYEGETVTISYNHDVRSQFVIPEVNADMNTLRVSVYNAGSNSTLIFVNSLSMVDTNPTDQVYFTKQIDGDLYEIFFGDGVFGKAINIGDIVTMTYLVTNGKEANGNSLFAYSGGADSTKSYTLLTLFSSSLGAPAEDKESIRFFAPLSYQAQKRAVTAQDYAAILGETYSNIETINVWGGQDNDPPQYGKVFISVKPYGRDSFSALEKSEFKTGIIAARSMITVVPEFVDPYYYDVEVQSNVYYNPSKTVSSVGVLESNIRDAISEYATTLSKFDSSFRHSILTNIVSGVDPSFVSTINTVRVRTSVQTYLGLEVNYSTDFKNPIAQDVTSTFYTSRFFLRGYSDRGYIKNNGNVLEFYTENASGTPFFQKNIGTLDFNGKIVLDKMLIDSLYDDVLEFVFYPLSYDIIPPNGTIVRIKDEHIKVSVIVDNLSQVRNSRNKHIFSTSR